MSIRIAFLVLAVAGLAIYAWKDWFKSLCGLIAMMAIMQHEDMPKTIMGIQGLNPWNLLMAVIVLAWLAARRRERLAWDMPRPVTVLLLLYLGVILVGFLRAVVDRTHLESYPIGNMISEELINTVKWVVPGLLLFDGCRTRKRLVLAVCCILLMYFGLALQAAKRLPPACAFGGGSDLQHIRLKLCQDIGYSACDYSTLLAGASWGLLGMLPMCRRRWQVAAVLCAFVLTSYAQALTGGRAGYIAWGAAGLVLCLVRWRKYLLLAPAIPLVLAVIFPGAAGRMFQGFGVTDVSGQTTINDYEVTSGRTLIWPYVIDKIHESPLIGYGRMAMARTGLRDLLAKDLGEGFPHPHNMYLELLLDNGLAGAVPILLFFAVILYNAAALFRTRDNPWAAAAGGLALGMVVAQLVAGIGSQHFYPRESTVGMWAAMMLMIRVAVERRRVTAGQVSQPFLAAILTPVPHMDGTLMLPRT